MKWKVPLCIEVLMSFKNNSIFFIFINFYFYFFKFIDLVLYVFMLLAHM